MPRKVLKKLRAEHGVTQEQAARRAGISVRTWARAEEHERIGALAMSKICTAFGLRSEELGMLPAPDLTSAARPASTTTVDGEVVSYGEMSGGVHPLVREDGEPYGIRLNGKLASRVVRGNSMAPIVIDGQHVIFHVDATIRDGDLVVVRLRDGDWMCKRWYRTPRGIVLQSEDRRESPVVKEESEIAEAYKWAGTLAPDAVHSTDDMGEQQ